MSERRAGVLAEWDDERGFGFIVPTGGGPRAFVHVSTFPRGRRPVQGDALTYAAVRDERNRWRAVAVSWVTSRSSPRPARRGTGMVRALAVSAAFAVLVVTLWRAERLPVAVLVLYSVCSAISLFWYGMDKSAATQGSRRSPEWTLHVMDLVGGWPGGLVARHAFRHKTRKQPFRATFWVTVVVNCVGLALMVATWPWDLDQLIAFLDGTG